MRGTYSKLGIILTLVIAATFAQGVAPAFASDYYFWYAHQDTKLLGSAQPPVGAMRVSQAIEAPPPLMVSAARAEYEGKQLVIKAVSDVNNLRMDPSELVKDGDAAAVIPSSEVSVHRVVYVQLANYSYGVPHSSLTQPDALPPLKLENGKVVLQDIGAGAVRSFYVLFHVPEGTPAGLYRGTIRISASQTAELTVPIQLEVYDFSVAKRTLKTSFGLDLRWAKYAATPNHLWPSRYIYPDRVRSNHGGDTIARWMKFMRDHRVSPQTLSPAWGRAVGPRYKDGPLANGTVPAQADKLRDYLGTGQATTFEGERLDFDTAHLPDGQYEPGYIDNPFSSASNRSKAANYYRSMRRAMAPYIGKAVVYTIDEPPPSARSFVEKYGAFVHKYAPGAKFMVTLHGKRFGYKPLRNVDIYVQRLHFYWYDYRRWVVRLRKAGKKVWIYSHTTDHQGNAPLYLLDKPLTESRIQGWFAYVTQANGLLYYNTNRWQGPRPTDRYYRDPYQSTLSSVIVGDNGRLIRSNGDGSLVYPGYYPKLGLNVVGSAPVSSLRMEALRDGLEDYEYLKLLEAKMGRAKAMALVARVINTKSFKDNFPRYSKSEYDMQAARDAMAAAIEGH